MTVVLDPALLLREPRRFLDRDTLRAWLAPIAPGAGPLAVIPEYVRAKRGQSLLAGVAIEWQTENGRLVTRGSIYATAGGVDGALSKARTLRLVEPPAGPALARLADPDALFLSFPNDRALRGLSAAADPRRLGNRLGGDAFPFGSAGLRVRARRTRVTPVRWKIGRRAVLHARLALRNDSLVADQVRDVWVRVYPISTLPLQMRRWSLAARLGPACRVPELLGADGPRGLLVTASADGTPLGGGGHAEELEPGAREAILSALAPLHTASPAGVLAGGLPVWTTRRTLESAVRPLADLAAWRPAWAPRIARIASALRRTRPRRPGGTAWIHGDLKVDQVLTSRSGLALLDWDELAIGDPLVDYASLAVDLADRSGAAQPDLVVEALAGRHLPVHGARAAWRWHVAAAAARRVLAGMQAGRTDWEDGALQTLERVESWLPAPAARHSAERTAVRPARVAHRTGGTHRPSPATTAAGRLRALLLDSTARGAAFALPGGSWRLDAVWPDDDEAALARFTEVASGDVFWCRSAEAIETWRSPEDPRLARLAALARSDAYDLVAHRLGRRAALRHRASGAYVHLREPRRAPERLARIRAVHALLAGKGVQLAAAPEPLAEGDGWRVPGVAGAPFDPDTTDPGRWEEIGAALAAIHRTTPAARLPRRGRARAQRDLERQARLRARVDDVFGHWIGEALEQLEPGFTSAEAIRSTVHGDLHPAQLLCGEAITWLDWEQAGAGEAEEDLGNLAAEIYRACGPDARERWMILRDRYEQQGSVVRPDVFRAYARIALLRLLSIHSWRDADRPRCEGRMDLWARWGEELRRW